MKKLIISFCLLLSVFLVACSTQSPDAEKLEEQYKVMVQSELDFLDQWIGKIGTMYVEKTSINMNTDKSSNMQGTVLYNSEKFVANDQEFAKLGLNIQLGNKKENSPIIFSGKLETLFNNSEMFLKILDFDLFAGTGNDEAKFINLLSKQLQGKWLALSEGEIIGISVIQTPKSSEIKDMLQSLLLETLSVDQNNQIKIYTLLSELLNLPIQFEDLIVEDTSTITYGWDSKYPDKATYEANIFYRTTTNLFEVIIKHSAQQLELTIKNIVDISTQEKSDQWFSITIQKNVELPYGIEVVKNDGDKNVLEIVGIIEIKSEDDTTILYNGFLKSVPIQLIKGEQIFFHIDGEMKINSENVDIPTIDGEIINLSEVL